MIKANDYPDAHCPGCISYIGEGTFCGVQLEKSGFLCPCAVCLSKSICDEDTCDEWYEYDNLVNEDRVRG